MLIGHKKKAHLANEKLIGREKLIWQNRSLSGQIKAYPAKKNAYRAQKKSSSGKRKAYRAGKAYLAK